MPQLLIRSDHDVRISAPSRDESGRWIRTAVLTVKSTGQNVEATSPPCADPESALKEVLATVRRQAGFAPD
ncbi:hypothetical protein BKE38_25055 [Pseudoroseomonas deserti]|uniref:Uncharacterized protein n=1 Tax=Teichococcus deserti TaxID=1817963 RepID=A0A1V2GVE8_9PROT|nr:hypothetical protein [Pseudoroseomonas deserti]ONG46622.1 hypothetical protein BKE38_25055 [Pseudoroseomonas deserti]